MSYFELAKQFVSKKELPPVDHSKIEYYPIKKNLYKQVRSVIALCGSTWSSGSGDFQYARA